MQRMLLSLFALAALTVGGCGGQAETARAQQEPATAGAEQPACPCPGMQPGAEGMAGMCPGMRGDGMAMPCPMCAPLPAGASVRSEPTPEGVALTFTTPNDDDVEALRAHVRGMAERHTRRHATDAAGRGRMMVPASTAEAIDVERGARLELRAIEPEDAAALRAHVQRMRCPMVAGQPADDEPTG